MFIGYPTPKAAMLDNPSLLSDNIRIILSGEETMPNKLVVVLSFVLLVVTSAYAASPEQPNSVPSEPNLSQSHRTPTLEEMAGIPKYLIDKANKGDVNAQYDLYEIYVNGTGIPQDYNESIKWLKKSAEGGCAKAQDIIGFYYQIGAIVPKDYNEAIRWYTKAAEHDLGAQYYLGVMYYYGSNFPQDYKEALKWFTKAAKQGSPSAQELLGEIYYTGQGVPQDYNEAIKWFTAAAVQGNAGAQFNLGLIYHNGNGITQDYKEATKWYTKAAEQGNASAQHNLGLLYYNGNGVSKDYKEAFKWYKKAAEQGNLIAYVKLSLMYYQGEGVIEDFVEAYKWALLAGMNGQDVAKFKQFIAAKMTPAQIAEAQNLAKEFVVKKENTKDKDSFGLEERTSPKASGSGFFISPSGYMITASHVVKESRSLKIFSSLGKFEAKVVLLDEPTDIAFLKVDGAEFPYLEVISSSSVNVGDKIFTFGFPNVPIQGTESKYTDGTISSLSGIDNNIRHFQVSIPVQPGNSGGPLLSAKGEVIGVVVSRLDDIGMLKATGTLPQNVNYAVKSAFILPLLENLPGWQTPKTKLNDEKMSNSEIINKARNSVALILVY
jgi:TPR repeat protein